MFAPFYLRKLFVFALQALLPLRRCPFFLSDFFGRHAPRVFPSSLSLPSERRDGGGRSRDALVLLPEGFPLLPLWSSVRCTRARFCLGSFVDWGSRSCSLAADSCYLFCPGWFSLLISHARRGVGEGESSGVFSLFSVASPASSLHARRGGGAGGSAECRSS